MQLLYSTSVPVGEDCKTISVYCGDVLDFPEKIDVLTTSAFYRSYVPTHRSLFGALHRAGIYVERLAMAPQIDLRKPCNIWLSKALPESKERIGRIGCIEFINPFHNRFTAEESGQAILTSIRSYFYMLDLAAVNDIPIDTVALPLLGSGDQHIDGALMVVPIINECVAALKRNPAIRRICFVERSQEKAELIAQALQNSYNLLALEQAKEKSKPQTKTLAFISYASPDKNIADNLCAKLERRGVPVWYAPRDVAGPYAAAITDAIARSTHFVVILSENSLKSQHVLNEIDLAFQNLPDKIKFKPLRIDPVELSSSFKYYLSRQHWMDAVDPPLELQLNTFVDKLLEDL